MTDASQDGSVKVTFSGILISSILHLSICQEKERIHILIKFLQKKNKNKTKHNQHVALISLWIKMQWHIKSVKFEEKVTVDENFRKKKQQQQQNKGTKLEGNLREIRMIPFTRH